MVVGHQLQVIKMFFLSLNIEVMLAELFKMFEKSIDSAELLSLSRSETGGRAEIGMFLCE